MTERVTRLYHVSRSANRESIRRHGLDWRRMQAVRGIAGSNAPEAEGIFLCQSAEEAEFFVEMAQEEGVDVWAIETSGLPVEENAEGWLICRCAIAPERLALQEADAKVGPESGRPGVREVWDEGRAYSWHDAGSEEEACEVFRRRIEELRQAGLGGITVERWAGGAAAERVKLEGTKRYGGPLEFSGYAKPRSGRPTAIHPAAAAGFEAEAGAYEHGRPSYPDAAVSWIAERLDLRPGRTVLDLAAGTGKLTRLLVETGANVIAVEPVAGMRARLAETVPNAEALEGTAEAIPLPDGSVDAATVAQAFHWFRAEQALAELYRVLRPGSGLALVWNVRDLDDPLQAAIDELLREHRHGAPSHEGQRWRPRVEGSPYFGPLEQREFRFVQELDADMLVGRVVSTSYIAVLPPERKREVADAARALARRLPEQFPFPYVTKAFLCFRQTDGA